MREDPALALQPGIRCRVEECGFIGLIVRLEVS